MHEGPRPVGRPRQFDDEAERKLLLEAGYAALRDEGTGFTIAAILQGAGVSTRAFYRQFESKDALLCAMYRRDSEWATRRLTKRLADAADPRQAVEFWIDEIFSFVRVAARAERVAVLGSILSARAEGIAEEAARGRAILVTPLRDAIEAGRDAGVFSCENPATEADLIAALVIHAVGLASPPVATASHDQAAVERFVFRALG